MTNVVVDAASIEVPRRARRAKTDRLDARKLVTMLVRYTEGERPVWHVVHVPSEADEDRRHLERERETLVADQTGLVNRIQGLLATQGVRLVLRATAADLSDATSGSDSDQPVTVVSAICQAEPTLADELTELLAPLGRPVHVIGDAVGIGRLEAALADARRIAALL